MRASDNTLIAESGFCLSCCREIRQRNFNCLRACVVLRLERDAFKLDESRTLKAILTSHRHGVIRSQYSCIPWCRKTSFNAEPLRRSLWVSTITMSAAFLNRETNDAEVHV